MRFTSGDVRDHIVSSKIDQDLRSGLEKQHSGGEVQRSTFARFFGSLDFRLLQQYLPTADVIKEATNCGGLTSPRQLAASAKAGSLIAAIVSFSA